MKSNDNHQWYLKRNREQKLATTKIKENVKEAIELQRKTEGIKKNDNTKEGI